MKGLKIFQQQQQSSKAKFGSKLLSQKLLNSQHAIHASSFAFIAKNNPKNDLFRQQQQSHRFYPPLELENNSNIKKVQWQSEFAFLVAAGKNKQSKNCQTFSTSDASAKKN